MKGQILAVSDDLDESSLAYQEAIKLLGSLGSNLELGRAHYYLANLHSTQGKAEEARKEADRAQQLFTECGAVHAQEGK